MSQQIFDAATKLYGFMLEAADSERVGDTELPVFRGQTTEQFGKLGISIGYYSRVMNVLKGQDCISQIQRGGQGLPSVIVLHYPPDHDKYLQTRSKPLTKRPDLAIVASEVEAIKTNMGGIDIKQMALDFESRLKRLESLLREGKD